MLEAAEALSHEIVMVVLTADLLIQDIYDLRLCKQVVRAGTGVYYHRMPKSRKNRTVSETVVLLWTHDYFVALLTIKSS